MAKSNFNMRMNPEIKHYATQIAEHYDRSLTYMIESLLLQAIEKERSAGFVFKKYVRPGGEVVGEGEDLMLKERFQKFLEE